MHIKTVKVTNPKNVLVQMPGFMMEKWAVQKGDGMEVHVSDDEKSIIIKPRKGLVTIRTGSDADKES